MRTSLLLLNLGFSLAHTGGGAALGQNPPAMMEAIFKSQTPQTRAARSAGFAQNHLVTLTNDGAVEVYNPSSFKLIRKVTPNLDITSLATSKRSSHVILTAYEKVGDKRVENASLHVLNIDTGKIRKCYQCPPDDIIYEVGLWGEFTWMQVSGVKPNTPFRLVMFPTRKGPTEIKTLHAAKEPHYVVGELPSGGFAFLHEKDLYTVDEKLNVSSPKFKGLSLHQLGAREESGLRFGLIFPNFEQNGFIEFYDLSTSMTRVTKKKIKGYVYFCKFVTLGSKELIVAGANQFTAVPGDPKGSKFSIKGTLIIWDAQRDMEVIVKEFPRAVLGFELSPNGQHACVLVGNSESDRRHCLLNGYFVWSVE